MLFQDRSEAGRLLPLGLGSRHIAAAWISKVILIVF